MTPASSAPRWPALLTTSWMRGRVGIVVGAARTIAAECVGGKARWVLDGPGIGTTSGANETLSALVGRFPPQRGRRRSIIAVLAPELVQCRPLFGVPLVRDEEIGAALVRENVTRFFRRTSEELSTSALETRADGRMAAAACDAELVRALRTTSLAHSMRLRAVIPVEGLPPEVPEATTEDPVVKLAVRAACADLGALRFDLSAIRGSREPMSRGRVVVAFGALAASVAMMLAVPPMSALVAARRDAAARGLMLDQERRALAVASDLTNVSADLVSIDEFIVSRRSTIALLAQLAATLPAGGALTQLQLDSTGGTLTALAPSADLVREGVSRAPLVTAVQVVGPVTRERSDGRDVERVNLRFLHRAPMRGGVRP